MTVIFIELLDLFWAKRPFVVTKVTAYFVNSCNKTHIETDKQLQSIFNEPAIDKLDATPTTLLITFYGEITNCVHQMEKVTMYKNECDKMIRAGR